MSRFYALKVSRKRFIYGVGIVFIILSGYAIAQTVSNVRIEAENGTFVGAILESDPSASNTASVRFTGEVSSSNCGLVGEVFCENFEQGPVTPAGVSGDFDPAKFSTNRLNNKDDVGLGPIGVVAVQRGEIPVCRAGSVTNPHPPGDTLVCDAVQGRGTKHALTSTTTHNYGDNSYRINQPFDIAGRTGKVVFDASLANIGPLHGWAQIAFTSMPIAVPGYYEDNARSGPPQDGFVAQFNTRCGLASDTVYPQVRAYNNFRTTRLTSQTDLDSCTSNVRTSPGKLNRVELRISQTRLDMYVSDFSSDGITFSTPKLVMTRTLTLPFTRGYLSFGGHNHASQKYSPPQTSWNVYWDNIAFDGPYVQPDRVYQVADNTSVINNYAVFGWEAPSNQSMPQLQINAVNKTGMTSAKVSLSLWINVYNTPNFSTGKLLYRLNGGTWRSRTFLPGEVWAFTTNDDFGGGAPFNLGYTNPIMDIPLTDLVDGSNTIQFAGDGIGNPVVANIDLLLR